MSKRSFVMYESYIEAVKILKPLERLELYETIFRYGLDGIYEEEGKKTITKCIMQIVMPQIDANNKSYRASVENGKKGGAPKGNNNAKKLPDDETPEERDIRYAKLLSQIDVKTT